MVKDKSFMAQFMRLQREVEQTGLECKRALEAADRATLELLEFVNNQPGFEEAYFADKGEEALVKLKNTLTVLRAMSQTRNVPQA